MQILAAVHRNSEQPLTIESVDLDDPRDNEILVRVVAVGICHTDLIAPKIMVPSPVVLGHEGSGIVEAVGSNVTKVACGDKVVLTFGSCGTCERCLSGEPFHCQQMPMLNFGCCRSDGSKTMKQRGQSLNGAFFQQSSFATYALATERNIVKIQHDVPLDLLGPLGCGIQTGAGAVMNTLHPEAGSTIAVFGAGAVGLSAIMAAKAVGCTTIIAVDINPARVALALELGATHTVDASDGNTLEQIRLITNGKGVHYSVETAGVASTFTAAIDSLSIGGKCALVTAPNNGAPFEFSALNLLFGRSVIGVLEGSSVPEIFIPRLIDLHQQGKFPFEKLLTYYPFSRINDAISDSANGVVVKAVLRMD